jgi:hypothetical protein
VNSFNCIREDEELRIALISCTSIKKAYKCPARDLYSESPRFQLAFSFAKLIADKIFILSAKYGLVPEDMIIEPYNETLEERDGIGFRFYRNVVNINAFDVLCFLFKS